MAGQGAARQRWNAQESRTTPATVASLARSWAYTPNEMLGEPLVSGGQLFYPHREGF